MSTKPNTLKDAINDKTPVKTRVNAEVDRLAPVFNAGLLFNMPVDQLPVEQQVAAWALLRSFAEMFGERLEQFREGLFVNAEVNGRPNKNGSLVMDVEGTEVCKQKRVSSTPDLEKVKELLAEAGIPVDEVIKMVPVTTTKVVVDQSKLDAYVEVGKLDGSRLAALYPVSWALTVKPSDEIEALLDTARGKMAALPPKAKTKKK